MGERADPGEGGKAQSASNVLVIGCAVAIVAVAVLGTGAAALNWRRIELMRCSSALDHGTANQKGHAIVKLGRFVVEGDRRAVAILAEHLDDESGAVDYGDEDSSGELVGMTRPVCGQAARALYDNVEIDVGAGRWTRSMGGLTGGRDALRLQIMRRWWKKHRSEYGK